MSLGCDITSLDSLVFDTPAESNTYFEKDAAAELDLWSNAKFTFDVKPGVGIYDEEKPSSPTPAQLEFSGLDPVTYDTLANYLDYELPKQQLEQQQSKPSLKRIQPRPLAPAPVPPVAATRQVLLPKPSVPLSPVADPNQLLAALLSTATCPGSPSSKKAGSVAGVKRPLEKAGDGAAVDDDKRRRNTAASARFRIKKKMREQAMEQSVREMSTKSEQLQERVNQLESEIKFLRNLLLDKVASNKQQQQQQQ